MEVTEVQEVKVKPDKKEIFEPPTISDPWELMAQFYESPRYKKKYEDFFKNKEISPEVTEKKKEQTFLEDHKARSALIDFGTEDVLFKYAGSLFPQRSREALEDYIKVAKDFEKAYRGRVSDEKALALDKYKSQYHDSASEALVADGIAPTDSIGKAIAELVLIDLGLTTPSNAKEPTSERLKRQLGVMK